MVTRLRHIHFEDGDSFDLQDRRVLVDAMGHPVVWHVMPSGPFGGGVYLTFLEVTE